MATLFGVDFDAADFLNGGHLDPVTINGQSLQRFIAALYAVSLEANAMKGVGALSTTSLAIGTGSKAFTFLPTSQSWDVGQIVRAVSLANVANFMVGYVTATGSGTVTLTVTVTGGSGTHADWFLSTPAPGLSLPLAVTQGGTGATAATDALGGVEVLIDEDTVSGTPAALEWTDSALFDGTYRRLVWRLFGLSTGTDNVDVDCYLRASAAYLTTSYEQVYESANVSGSTISGVADSISGRIILTGATSLGNAAGESLSATVVVENPGAAVANSKQFTVESRWFNTSGVWHRQIGGGYHPTASALDGFKVQASSGNLANGWRWQLWGAK